MTKRRYLELMGIDVWQKRRPQATASLVPSDVEQPIAETNLLAAAGDGAAVLASVRESLGATAGSDANTPIHDPASAPAPALPVREPNEAPPEFYLTLSHFQGLTMVNLYPNGFAAIPGNHHRFLTTLHFALSRAKTTSQTTEFRWPMVKNSQISQSQEEAKKVLGRHLEQCQPELLVFGTEAAALLGSSTEAVYREENVRGRNLLVVEEAEVYFREPEKRQTLWRYLFDLRARLRSRAP